MAGLGQDFAQGPGNVGQKEEGHQGRGDKKQGSVVTQGVSLRLMVIDHKTGDQQTDDDHRGSDGRGQHPFAVGLLV